MTARTIVVAPDSFKGSATATEVTEAIIEGWSSVRALDVMVPLPMADGGEGTLEAFELAVPGSERRPVSVQGPDGRQVEAFWLALPDGTAVVELANTSGLSLVAELIPHDAHSAGFGQAIAAALDAGAERLLLAVGGSSSTDGGAGALVALGAVVADAGGAPVAPGNRGLHDVARVDLTGARQVPSGGVVVLGDVTNPLLGPDGAAAVFGPQKGASGADIDVLESGLERFAALLPTDPAAPGAGAAGGVGFGLLAWGATLSPGSRAVGEALGLPAAVSGASIVITGEGRFDSQTDGGKVVSYVQGLARTTDVPTLLVAGLIEADTQAFALSRSLTQLAGSQQEAIARPLPLLRRAAAELAQALDEGRSSE